MKTKLITIILVSLVGVLISTPLPVLNQTNAQVTAGTLDIAISPDTPDEAIIAVGNAGSSNVPLTLFDLTADWETMRITEIEVKMDGTASSNAYQHIMLYAGSIQYGPTVLVPAGATTVKFDLSGENLIIPAYSKRHFALRTDLNGIYTGASSGRTVQLNIEPNKVKAIGETSGVEVTATGSVIGNPMILRKSVPVFGGSSPPTTYFLPGTNTFEKWNISADSKGDVGWKKIVFVMLGWIPIEDTSYQWHIGATGSETNVPSVAGVWITKHCDAETKLFIPTNSIKIRDVATAVEIEGSFTITNNPYSSIVSFVATNEQIIAAGSTKTYSLQGDFSLEHWIESDAMQTGIDYWAENLIIDDYATVVNEDVSFVWTDRSAIDHSTATADWTNEYKVSGIAGRRMPSLGGPGCPPENQPPNCSLSATPTFGETPLEVEFTLNANDPNGSIASWELDVNSDGTPEYSGSGNLSNETRAYTYQNKGEYTAKLIVTDDGGLNDHDTITITVKEILPENQCDIPVPDSGGMRLCINSGISCVYDPSHGSCNLDTCNPVDKTPPQITNFYFYDLEGIHDLSNRPTVLPSSITSVVIGIEHNESAICSYSTSPEENPCNANGCVSKGMIGMSPNPNCLSTGHEFLAENLSPENNYSFYIWCVDWSGNVTTQPYIISFSIASLENQPFTFVHIADVHIGWDFWAKDLVLFRDTLLRLNETTPKPDFILIGGDNVDWNHYWFFEEFRNTLNNKKYNHLPYYVIPGNHDRYKYPVVIQQGAELAWGGNDFLEQYHDSMRSPIKKSPDEKSSVSILEYFEPYSSSTSSLTQGLNRYNYKFEYNGYFFIGLDSGEDYRKTYFRLPDDPRFCPEGTGLSFNHINALNEQDKAKPKIIFMHHPIFTGVQDEEFENASIVNQREEFIEYCKNNNVKMVLSGHTHQDHIFDRNRTEAPDWPSTPSNWQGEPLFIQTPSATKGEKDDDFPCGYRIISVNGSSVYPYPYTETKPYPKKWASFIGPVHPHVYDSQGRHTGYSSITTDIPHSDYTGYYDSSTPQVIILYNTNEDYEFKVMGIDEGTYKLNIESIEEGEATTFTAIDIPITLGENHQYTIDWQVLPYDVNGDGIVDLADLIFVRNRLNQDVKIDDNPKADVNRDGKINILDLVAVRNNLDKNSFSFRKSWSIPGDVNEDCQVDHSDLVFVRDHLAMDPNSSPEAERCDVNKDGKINILDLVFVRNNLGTSCE